MKRAMLRGATALVISAIAGLVHAGALEPLDRDQAFESVGAQPGVTFIDFYAEW